MTLRKQKGSPFWYCQFKGPDGWVRKTTGTTDKEQAQAIARAFVQGVRAASRGELDIIRAEKIVKEALAEIAEIVNAPLPTKTIGAFFGDWLASQQKASLAESTLQRYRSVVESLKSFLGAKWHAPLPALTPSVLVQWRTSLSARLSPVSVAGFIKVASFALRSAVQLGLITENPTARMPRVASRPVNGGRRPFTVEEVKRVLEKANGSWRGMVMLGFYTGQRLMDLATLRWSQVDLQAKVIAFAQEKKHGKYVPVPIAPQLERWFQEQDAPDEVEAYLFPDLAGTDKAALSKQFRRILVTVKLVEPRSYEVGARDKREGARANDRRETSELSFHSLRHALATQLRAVGASEAVAKAVLGHESDAVAKRYTHIGVEELRPVMGRLPEL